MTHREIRAQFILQGKKQKTIAQKLGVSEIYVSFVVSGKAKSLRIRKAIAKELGFPLKEVFPDAA